MFVNLPSLKASILSCNNRVYFIGLLVSFSFLYIWSDLPLFYYSFIIYCLDLSSILAFFHTQWCLIKTHLILSYFSPHFWFADVLFLVFQGLPHSPSVLYTKRMAQSQTHLPFHWHRRRRPTIKIFVIQCSCATLNRFSWGKIHCLYERSGVDTRILYSTLFHGHI